MSNNRPTDPADLANALGAQSKEKTEAQKAAEKAEKARRDAERKQYEQHCAAAWVMMRGKEPKWERLYETPEEKEAAKQKDAATLQTNPHKDYTLLKDGYYQKGKEGKKSVVELATDKDGVTTASVHTGITSGDFKKSYSLAMDLLQYQGSNTIVINYGKDAEINFSQLKTLMDIAASKKPPMAVELSDIVYRQLAGLNDKSRAKILDRLDEVNALAKAGGGERTKKIEELAQEKMDTAAAKFKADVFSELSTKIDKEEKLETKYPGAADDAARSAELKKEVLDPVKGDTEKEIDAIEQQMESIGKRIDQVEQAREKIEKHQDSSESLMHDKHLADKGQLQELREEGEEPRGKLYDALNKEGLDLAERLDTWKEEVKRISAQAESLPEPLEQPGKDKLAEQKLKIDALQNAIKDYDKKLVGGIGQDKKLKERDDKLDENIKDKVREQKAATAPKKP